MREIDASIMRRLVSRLAPLCTMGVIIAWSFPGLAQEKAGARQAASAPTKVEPAKQGSAGKGAPKAGGASVDSMRPDRETTEGVVIGNLHRATDTLSWKGIPYARPPVGPLRWKAPREPAKRSAPLPALAFRDPCPQYRDHDGDPATPQIVQGQEDCLYLNVWRPRVKATDLPIYLWIHGGGNSISWPLVSDTDLGSFANRAGMVVVTLQYRLGPLGWLSHPALRTGRKGDEQGDSGNFALLDIIRALSWVKTNAPAFGADPARVTIAGESAGGQNVLCLLGSPLAKGLFANAISQSGVVRPSSPAEGEAHVNQVLAKLMVKDGRAKSEQAAAEKVKGMKAKEVEAYLRSKAPRDLLETYPEGKRIGMITFPTAFGDGTVLPADFLGAFKSGKYNKVPVLLGSNKEETKLFQMRDPRFAPLVRDGSLFKDPNIARFYDLVARYLADGWKAMAVDGVARLLRSNADQPGVYAYHFLWGAGGMAKSVQPFPYNQLVGASHTLEIEFVFGTEALTVGNLVFSPKNRPGRMALSAAMMDYWAQFARTGDPNREGSGLPAWPAWSNEAGKPKSLLLDANLTSHEIRASSLEVTDAETEKSLKAEPMAEDLMPIWNKSTYRAQAK